MFNTLNISFYSFCHYKTTRSVFLPTGIDSSHLLRMTINISLIMTADPLLAIRMTSFISRHYDAFPKSSF